MHSDTYILTRSGLKQAQDLFNEESELVCKSNFSKAKPFSYHGNSKALTLTTTNGHAFTGRWETKLLTPEGFKRLQDFRKGDRLQLSYTRGLEWGPDDEFIEGYSMGKIEVDMKAPLAKRSSSFLKGYLSGVFSARGGVYNQTNGSLRYVSSYNDLRLIQIVLGAFGIHSNIMHGSNTVYINLTSSAIIRFSEDIGLQGPIREKLDIFMNEYAMALPKLQREWTTVDTLIGSLDMPMYSTKLEQMNALTADCLIVQQENY